LVRGQRRELLSPIPARGGRTKLEWLIRMPPAETGTPVKVTVEAVAPSVGSTRAAVRLTP
ncbi:MAG: hypothetical protein D6741_14755, partial [Planctomycetota bacterium]